jgi:hypothetical protein
MWAWADAYDVFNTAALTGQQVSTAIRGMAVKSYTWGTPNVNTGDALSNCMLPSGTSQATAALASANAVCMVHVNAVNTAPAKGLAVTVAVAAGMPPDPSTQVNFVWCADVLVELSSCTAMASRGVQHVRIAAKVTIKVPGAVCVRMIIAILGH